MPRRRFGYMNLCVLAGKAANKIFEIGNPGFEMPDFIQTRLRQSLWIATGAMQSGSTTNHL
jgi:hypothetical protein